VHSMTLVIRCHDTRNPIKGAHHQLAAFQSISMFEIQGDSGLLLSVLKAREGDTLAITEMAKRLEG
jgi:hypothetical protein